MSRSVFLSFLLGLVVLVPLLTAATLADPKLYVNSPQSRTDHVRIQYEVNMPGFVELHLFDPEDKKIWIKGKVTDRVGLDYIAIPKKPLQAGERYRIVLKFKGKDYKSSFYAD